MDTSVPARQRVLAILRRALRLEWQRGRSGHWCYDLARHRNLLTVYRQEVTALRCMKRNNASDTVSVRSDGANYKQ